jgi:hypothetical protein
MRLVEIPWNPPARTLRQFAFLWLVACTVLAFRIGEALGPIIGVAVVVCAVTFGVAGLVRPRSVRLLFLALALLTLPIGLLVSNALLMLVYLVVLTPVAVVFRLVGRDALNRRFEPARASYWEVKTVPADPARYLRTF